MSTVIDAPCKGCSNRCVGCHSCCPEYIDWRKLMDSIQQYTDADLMLIDKRKRIQLKKIKGRGMK